MAAGKRNLQTGRTGFQRRLRRRDPEFQRRIPGELLVDPFGTEDVMDLAQRAIESRMLKSLNAPVLLSRPSGNHPRLT